MYIYIPTAPLGAKGALMKRKRTLSLVLSLILAFSLFAGIAPAAQADDAIGTLLDSYLFKKDYMD